MPQFKFNKDYSFNGRKVSFIGYMSDGENALVAKKTSGNYCVNVIVPLGELSDLIQGSKTKSEPANKIILVDVASV